MIKNKKNLIKEYELFQTIFHDTSNNNYNNKLVISNFLNINNSHLKKYYYNKNNYEVIFNISQSASIIWDLIFIGQYLYNKLSEESQITIEKRLKNNLFIYSKDNQPNIIVEHNKEYHTLKQSVIIVDLLNTYLSNNEYQIVTRKNIETIKINFLENTCYIPLEYLQEFSRGIIPLEKEKNLAIETDKITLLLFQYFNLNYKSIPNFYYRVHIDRINFLLELVKEDKNLLDKLPAAMFSSAVPVSWIKKIVKLTDNNIENIIKLPDTIFLEQPYIDFIKELISLDNNDIKHVTNLSPYLFSRNTSIDKIKDLLSKTKSNKLSELNNISSEIINCSERRLNILLRKNVSNLQKLQKLSPYIFSNKTTEERLQLLINLVNEDYKLLTDINYNFYIASNKRVRFILQLIQNNPNKMSQIPDILFNEKVSETRINLLLNLSENDLNKLSKLPEFIFYDKIVSEERILYLYQLSKNKFNKFTKLPEIIFLSETTEKKISELYTFVNNKVEELIEIPKEIYTNKINIFEYRDILQILTNQNELSYQDYKLVYPFILNNIEDKKHIYQRLDYLLTTITSKSDIISLPKEIFSLYTSNIRILFILDLLKYDLPKLSQLPKEFFNKDIKASRLIIIYNLVKGDLTKLSQLPKEIYNCHQESIEVLFWLDKEYKAKSLLGTGDKKTISLIIYMLSIFNIYNENMANQNQVFNNFQIFPENNCLKENSNELVEALKVLNNTLEQLPVIIRCNEVTDLKSNLLLLNKKIDQKVQNLESVISKQNNIILESIKLSLSKLRIHIKKDSLILEDYTLDENSYRNHTFKIEGTFEDYFNLATSLITKDKIITNKTYAEEIYSRLDTKEKKQYGKMFITTTMNKVISYKNDINIFLIIQSRLNKKGIKNIMFYLEDDTVNVRYQKGNKKYYYEINELIEELKK